MNTMNEDDSILDATVENSIEFTMARLNSNNPDTILDTITQIRNLIIGNNKYKTFFMHESLISRLMSLTVEHLKCESSTDLINQIIIIFASFSLGNLDSIISLINGHNLNELLFNIIKQTVTDQTHQNKSNIKLIESVLRCIANLYTTCQLVPSLIFSMDKDLYEYIDENEQTCLDLLLKVYPISNSTKKTVIRIVSISSMFQTTIFTSLNRYVSETSGSNSRRYSRLVSLNERIKLNRAILLKSDCITKFAHLLTSLLEPIQLNVLKFYASICFENIDALNSVLTCNYYECSLLDLISAYLSRENGFELQLYAAKCLTNLCRSLQILNNSRKVSSKKNVSKITRSNYKFKKLIKHKIDECGAATIKFDELEFDNEADYEEEEDHEDNECNEEPDEELNEESELELDENDIELESKTPPTADEISMLNEEFCRNDAELVEAIKLESLYKYVDTSSQLIKRRTLPTLIRLCCTYSCSYRNSNMKNSNLSDLVNSSSHNTGQTYANLKANKETNSQNYFQNIYLLIQSINTLTYLIELNVDLQATASFLEQIVPTLAVNILEAYSIQNLNKIKLTKSQKTSRHFNALKTEVNNSTRKRRLFQSLSNESNIAFSNDDNKKAGDHQCKADTGPNPNNINIDEKTNEQNTSKCVDKKELASLYSMFYLNYNQYSTKAAQYKQNEHQYQHLASYEAELLKKLNADVFTEISKSSVKMITRVNRYLSMLDKTVHKRLASSCFHALGALASNNEDTRRQITENGSLVCRLIDSIQLNSKSNKTNDENSEESESDGENEEDTSTYPELEEAFKKAEDSVNIENIDQILSIVKSKINSDNTEFQIDESNEDFINSLDEEFDDCNQTDSDLLRLSGLCLLHSLSRSVHQLRTKFLDKKIWMPIIDLIKRSRKRRLEKRLLLLKYKRLKLMQLEQEKTEKLEANRKKLSENYEMTHDMESPVQMKSDAVKTSEEDLEEMDSQVCEEELFNYCDSLNEQNLLSVTTAILANLLLEFSPSKEIMEENGIIKILVELIDNKNHSIRVNCMWALMNTAFQADQIIKEQIISTITMDKLFQLLIEQDETLIMKTLGLIRNLITNRQHIDQIMNTHGTKVIQAIIMILEGDHSLSIKEQALCILANVADGQTAKEFIMGNEDLLRKINSFMTYNSVELQIASVAVVSNLIWSADEGAIERQNKLKEMGVHRILQRLLQHNDPLLFDKVKNTLQQFALPNNTITTASATPAQSQTQ